MWVPEVLTIMVLPSFFKIDCKLCSTDCKSLLNTYVKMTRSSRFYKSFSQNMTGNTICLRIAQTGLTVHVGREMVNKHSFYLL